MLDFLIVYIFV